MRGRSALSTALTACVLLGLALPLLAPQAAACSIAYPQPFERLEWAGPNTLFTTVGFAAGNFTLGNASFEGLVTTFPGHHFAMGANGTRVAYGYGREGAPDVPEGDIAVSSCGPEGGHLELVSLDTGERLPLLDGAPTALASWKDGFVAAHWTDDDLMAWTWNNTTLIPRAIGPNPVLRERMDFDATQVRHLAIDGNGTRLAAAYGTGQVWLFNLTSGDVLDENATSFHLGNDDPITGLAWSPDGSLLAVGTSQYDHFGTLAIWHVAEGEAPHAETVERSVEGLRGFEWGPGGLAAAYATYPAVHDSREVPNGILRLYPLAPLMAGKREVVFRNSTVSGGMAWSPDGERLAVSENGRLRLYDDKLRQITLYDRPVDNQEPVRFPILLQDVADVPDPAGTPEGEGGDGEIFGDDGMATPGLAPLGLLAATALVALVLRRR